MFINRKRIENEWQISFDDPSGSKHYVIRTTPFLLGSDKRCEVVIDDPSIAEEHIIFTLDDGKREILVGNLAEGFGKTALIEGKPFVEKTFKKGQKKKIHIQAGSIDLFLYDGPVEKDVGQYKDTPGKKEQPKWYYVHEGIKYGPLSKEKLIHAARENHLLPDDDTWHSGIDYRMKAREVPELFLSMPGSMTDRDVAEDDSRRGSDGRFFCPYCWTWFNPEEILFISRHPDLLVHDPVLGSQDQLRFLPRRVRPIQCALDSMGQRCTDMACPNCHLRIPTPFLNTSHFIISTMGTVSSGKSYFLATSIWRLRNVLFKNFGFSFTDIDNSTNEWLNEYEEKLFYAPDFKGRIERTQFHNGSSVQREVKIDGISKFIPVPCIFTLSSKDPVYSDNLSVIFYDNAGEHFKPGMDSIDKPGTLHILSAKALLFLFDPTAEPRFQSLIKTSRETEIYPQRRIILEIIERLRRHMGLKEKDRLNIPVIIVLSKVDLLKAFTGSCLKLNQKHCLTKEPWIQLEKNKLAALDTSYIEKVSAIFRKIFNERIPDFVDAVESFAGNVTYIPVSALGHQPADNFVNSADIRPLWAEIPFLYILSTYGLIPSVTKKDTPRADACLEKQTIKVRIPDTDYCIEMPIRYKGLTFRPMNGNPLTVP